jgi:hypothetical protein
MGLASFWAIFSQTHPVTLALDKISTSWVAAKPGLPDGLLSYQKSKFGYIFEGL